MKEIGEQDISSEEKSWRGSDVKIKDHELSFSLFSFLILISFNFIFHFSIFRTLGLGVEVIGHTVTSVTSNGIVTTLIIGLKRRK